MHNKRTDWDKSITKERFYFFLFFPPCFSKIYVYVNPEQIHFLIPWIERLPPEVQGIFPEAIFEGIICLKRGVNNDLINKIISSIEL